MDSNQPLSTATDKREVEWWYGVGERQSAEAAEREAAQLYKQRFNSPLPRRAREGAIGSTTVWIYPQPVPIQTETMQLMLL